MNLQYRIELLSRLGEYMLSEEEEWLQAKERAFQENNWFIPEFIDLAVRRIAHNFLRKDLLGSWMWAEGQIADGRGKITDNREQITDYREQRADNREQITDYREQITDYREQRAERGTGVTVGIVMAGNIPLVGFHDWLCVFISGHKAMARHSSKDKVLITHLVGKIAEWSAEAGSMTSFSEMLKGCDAYIATGSNNSSRYFDHYFGRFPHIIRRNRTSVAILGGNETPEQLERLADDVYTYFGLGCRNVTKIYVPEGYDFVPLLEAFRKYNWVAEHNKYKNNYDYNLALHLLNKKFYMTNGSLLLIEDEALFSPISQLNYEYYSPNKSPVELLMNNSELQCIVGGPGIPFGTTQEPSLTDYADGVDTLKFLAGLS